LLEADDVGVRSHALEEFLGEDWCAAGFVFEGDEVEGFVRNVRFQVVFLIVSGWVFGSSKCSLSSLVYRSTSMVNVLYVTNFEDIVICDVIGWGVLVRDWTILGGLVGI
jgi:hypothetical protein